jgi:hypothetical protein
LTHKDPKKVQNDEGLWNSLLIGLAGMLGQSAGMKLWRRAALAIVARFFSLDSRGSTLTIHWQAVDNAFALIFVMGEFVLALFRDQQMTYVISS